MEHSEHKSNLRNYLQKHKEPNSTPNHERVSTHPQDGQRSIRKTNSAGPKISKSSTNTSNGEAASKSSGHQNAANRSKSGTTVKVKSPNKSSIQGQTRQRDVRPKQVSNKTVVRRRGKVDIDWLPDEILMEIFEYFMPQDLLSCARVCKRWRGLASDNLLWQNIYKQYAAKVTKASSKVQKSKAGKQPTIPENPPSSFWKSYCVQKGSDFRNDRAIKILEKKKQPINSFTGLPKGTQEALQKSGNRWVLCFVDDDQNEHTVFHKDVFYFDMAVCVRWYDFELPSVRRIRKLRIYSGNPIFFDEKGQALSNSPLQRSLLYERDFQLGRITSETSPLASDEVVNVFNLPDGVIVATWKDGSDIAFISMSFHADCLVKRCLFGKGDRQWMPPRHRPLMDDIDPKYGLHSYSCTLELRNMRTSFWREQFPNLHCLPDFKDGYAVMQLIDPDRSFERSWVERKVCLMWKTEALKGIIKDVCFLDVTVLDDQKKPLWGSSGLIKVQNPSDTNAVTYEYDGDYFVLHFSHPLGKVQMILIWEELSKKYYITGLQLHLSLDLINRWFGRRY